MCTINFMTFRAPPCMCIVGFAIISNCSVPNVDHLKFIALCSTHFVKQTISLLCSNSPLPFPILSHKNPIHVLTSCYCNIHFNFALPYTALSSKWSLSFRGPHLNHLCISLLPHTCHMPSPAHPR